MESASTNTPVAGWYEDPYDAAKIRYWSGSVWTDAAQPLPPAPPAVATPAATAPPDASSPAAAFIPPELRAPADDPQRAKIVTAVAVAAVVLVVAIGGAFLLLNNRSGSDSAQPQSADQAKAVDAQAAEQARTAQTAIETYATDNNGSYSGATSTDLQRTESSLSSATSLQVASGRASYSISVTSSTGDTLTIQRGDDGALNYACSTPGVGICPTSGNWN
ncbi:hypothetical protein BH10ACT11_BH10ACT11_16940 [soil metagenome]